MFIYASKPNLTFIHVTNPTHKFIYGTKLHHIFIHMTDETRTFMYVTNLNHIFIHRTKLNHTRRRGPPHLQHTHAATHTLAKPHIHMCD